MRIDFQLGRPARRCPNRRRHVGRRRQLGHGRARRAHRRRGDRRDASALRSWRSGAAHRAPAARARTFTTRSRSPTGSASRIMFSITKAASASGVIDRFVDEYAHGRTPVPCACCNQGVKFVDLVAFARELGADCLATGHYVRRVVNGGRAELHKGADPRRDQSYFLYGTTARAARFSALPAGRPAEGRGSEASPPSWSSTSPPSPTARTSASFRTAIMPALVKRLRPETAGAGRDRRP